ncbi:hypothetical protein ACLOAV_000596 [Pseudogymnoascus australis]
MPRYPQNPRLKNTHYGHPDNFQGTRKNGRTIRYNHHHIESNSERSKRLRQEMESDIRAHTSLVQEQGPSPAQIQWRKELLKKKDTIKKLFPVLNSKIHEAKADLIAARSEVELAMEKEKQASVKYDTQLKDKMAVEDEYHGICAELDWLGSRLPSKDADSVGERVQGRAENAVVETVQENSNAGADGEAQADGRTMEDFDLERDAGYKL